MFEQINNQSINQSIHLRRLCDVCLGSVGSAEDMIVRWTDWQQLRHLSRHAAI